MNKVFKEALRDKVLDNSKLFNLDIEDILLVTFVYQVNNKFQISAPDMANCVSTILEYPEYLLSKDIYQNFTGKENVVTPVYEY